MHRVALVVGIAGAVIGGALAFDSDTYHKHQAHQKYAWFSGGGKARELSRMRADYFAQKKAEEERRQKTQDEHAREEARRRREEARVGFIPDISVPAGITLDPPQPTASQPQADDWITVKPSPFAQDTGKRYGQDGLSPLPPGGDETKTGNDHQLYIQSSQVDVQENGVATASIEYSTGAITIQLISGGTATAETSEPDVFGWLQLGSAPAIGFLIPWSVLWLVTWVICGFFVEVPDPTLKSTQDSGSPQ
jgi:hypothetical protein